MALRNRSVDREGKFSGNRVERAIIDIGSNTVRLVIYGGSPRAPVVLFNEKVAARLGREIAQTGRLADEAVSLAMRGLRRYALLLSELDIERIDVVATAAVREAGNGPQFLADLQALGFEPRLLSGEDEARISAMGVIGAFPGAKGVVADLGGGSLELIEVAENCPGHGVSLPLGTLRLPDHRSEEEAETQVNLAAMLIDAEGMKAKGGSLYLVGGTWRAMAVLAMAQADYPLTDPHGYELPCGEAITLAQALIATSPNTLSANPRITSMRASYMPDAGSLLLVLLDKLKPDTIVFSSWGLREGVLFDELEDYARGQDPLLAGIGEFAALRGAPPMLATRVAAWTVGIVGESKHRSERLRLAATMLALASMQIEPNLRTEIGQDWALHKRWIGVDAAGRAMMAAAIAANKRACDPPEYLYTLATKEQIEEAIGWGLAIRLCRRLGGRSTKLFNVSSLKIEGAQLVLSIDEEFSALFGLPSEKDLALLAGHLALEPEFRVLRASKDG